MDRFAMLVSVATFFCMPERNGNMAMAMLVTVVCQFYVFALNLFGLVFFLKQRRAGHSWHCYYR